MVSKEQHIRAMALDSAVRLVTGPNVMLEATGNSNGEQTEIILNIADKFADYISMGRD